MATHTQFTPKLHLTAATIEALKYLDANQDRLSGESGKIADSLLNIIDNNPHLFIGDDNDDDDHHRHHDTKSPQLDNKTNSKPDSVKSQDGLSTPSTTTTSPTTTADSSSADKTLPSTSQTSTPPHSTQAKNQTGIPTEIGLGGIKNNVESVAAAQHCNGFIYHTQLNQLSHLLTQLNYPTPSLNHLVRGTALCFHPEKKTNYTPEFASHLAFLRQRQAKDALLSSMQDTQSVITGQRVPNRVIGSNANQNDRGFMSKGIEQMGAPIHFVAVSATCAFVFYWVGKTLFMHNKLVHVVFAIIGLLFGFILETAMFVMRDFRESQGEQYRLRAEQRKEQMIKAQIMSSLFPKGRSAVTKRGSPEQENSIDTQINTNTQEHQQEKPSVPATRVDLNETKKDR